MFGLTQYNRNGALMATTGFMLAPIASALNRVGYTVSRDEEMPSIAPAEPSSEWSEWLTSGYVGDFLGWAGKQLAEIGGEVFPAPSIAERRVAMRDNKRMLKQLFAESLIGAEVEKELQAALVAYLREAIMLVKLDALRLSEWKQDLARLKQQAKRSGVSEVATILDEYEKQANALSTSSESSPICSAVPPTLDKLTATSGVALNGINTNDYFGSSVSNAGDVNGDGIADFIVGSPGVNAFTGAAYVIYGKEGGVNVTDVSNLSANDGFILNGVDGGAYFALSVGNAGDVNGDGITDIIIGESYRVSTTQPGKAYVIYGKVGGVTVTDLSDLSPSDGFELNGVDKKERFGCCVNSAGDVNGDGIGDVIIGAYYGTPGQPGKAYVIYGNSGGINITDLSNLDSSQGFVLTGADTGGAFGFSADGAGDVNGDGVDDLVIGAFAANAYAGKTYVIYGKRGGVNITDLSNLTPAEGLILNGVASGGQFGESVSGAGDVNGDGISDLVIGGSLANAHAGEVYVIYGKPGGINITDLSDLSASDGLLLNGVDSNDRLGYAVNSAGDVNGDGVADIIMGAFYANSKMGRSYVIYGKRGGIDVTDLSNLDPGQGFVLDGVEADGSFGWAVDTAGDVNGDGKADVVIGAFAANTDTGTTYVVYSPCPMLNCSTAPDLNQLTSTEGTVLNGINTNDYFGYSVGDAGDVNADGIADIIVGASGANSFTGAAYVIYGKQGGINIADISNLEPSDGFILNGVDSGSYFGFSVAGAGDVNGDGIADFIIGESYRVSNVQPGKAYVIYGKEGGVTVTDLSDLSFSDGFELNGIDQEERFGCCVNSAGDVNGDGVGDIVIGAYYGTPGQPGKTYVIYGQVGGVNVTDLSNLDSSQGFVLTGADTGGAFGFSADGAGDVNGDGVDDLVIGAFAANAYAGKAYVIYGKRGGVNITDLSNLTPAEGLILNGVASGGQFGESVSGAGDVNGDGISDLIIGGSLANAHAGEVYVIYGKPGGINITDLSNLNASDGFLINGAEPNSQFGYPVNAAGDVNRDGIADFIIGAFMADDRLGKAYVIYGKQGGIDVTDVSNLSPDQGFVLNGVDTNGQFGWAASGTGDINADGAADVVVGAFWANSDAGKTYVVYSPCTYSSTNPSPSPVPSPSYIPIPTPMPSPTPNPSPTPQLSTVIDLGALGNAGFTMNGVNASDYSGRSVSGAGDVNNDGIADIIIGAYEADPSGRVNAGQIYVVFGASNGLAGSVIDLGTLSSTGFTINGAVTGDISGFSVASAGDVNSDSYDDIIIGVSAASQSYVVFGASDLAGSVIDLGALGSAGFTINGFSSNDQFGISVSGAGDVNGDGVDDVIIGASWAGQLAAGQSYVIFGKSSGLEGSVINLRTLGDAGFTINGANASDHSGRSVSGAGDVNGDGFADIIVGAYNAGPAGQTQAGQSYVVFGASSGLEGSVVDLGALGSAGFTINGAIASDKSGFSVADAGDVNADGFADIIIGAYNASSAGQTQAGQSYVIFGAPSGLEGSFINLGALGSAGVIINGATSYDKSGYSVAGAGDVNGDGFADVIVGAYNASPLGRARAGQSYVVYGASSSLEGSIIDLGALGSAGFTVNGAVNNDDSGISVAGAGDVNDDGIVDIIIGAYEASPSGRVNAGQSYVVFGFVTPPTPRPTPTPTSVLKPSPAPAPTPSEKHGHFERNAILGGVIAGGVLATGLFCFFHHKKKNNSDMLYVSPLDGIRHDEFTPLKQGQYSEEQSSDGYSL